MASIQKRPNGKYRARYRDAAGKEHARHFDRKRDAEQWIATEVAAVATGTWTDPRAGAITWAEWAERWMESQTWAEGTRLAAQTAVASVPWREAKIRSVRPTQVQGWVTAERDRGLAASTLRMRLNYVQMCFLAAVRDKIIPTSPAVGVKAPPLKRAEATMKTLSAEQLARALEVAGDFRAFVAVCAFAGLRLGEAAGLRRDDVDFLRRTIRVERQVQGQTIATTEVVEPKAGSTRTVFVPEELTTLLAAHVADQAVGESDHLFRTPLGYLYNRGSAGAEWRRVRRLAGLPASMTLHTLRHTFASNLIAQGCDVVTVQRALGHSKPSITLNVYSHLWPSAEDKTRLATADFMREVMESADSGRTAGPAPQVRG